MFLFFALFCILFLDKVSAICVRKKRVWGEGNPCVMLRKREPSGCPQVAVIRLRSLMLKEHEGHAVCRGRR